MGFDIFNRGTREKLLGAGVNLPSSRPTSEHAESDWAAEILAGVPTGQADPESATNAFGHWADGAATSEREAGRVARPPIDVRGWTVDEIRAYYRKEIDKDWGNAEFHNQNMNEDVQARLAYEATGVHETWQKTKETALAIGATVGMAGITSGLATAFPTPMWFLGMSQAKNEEEAAFASMFYPFRGARSNRGMAKGGSTRSSGAVNLASPGRTKHILQGDATGGGHKFGLSRILNGKSKFPPTWSEKRVMHAVSEVATSPNSTWTQQTGKAGAKFTKKGVPVKFKVDGEFDGVKIRAIVQGDDIVTAFPTK